MNQEKDGRLLRRWISDVLSSRPLLLAGVLCCVVSPRASAECGPAWPTCSLRQYAPVVFLGTLVSQTDGVYHFRVDEAFNGVKGKTIDVDDVPMVEGSSGFAGVDRQYLVFAKTIKLDDGVHAYVGGCGRNLVELTHARILLEQLRREKNGQRIATVYGRLIRTMYQSIGIWDEDYIRPLPGVVVRFQSRDGTFTTTTKADGTYAFDRLPNGTYRISADLPRALELRQTILKEPLEPVEVESRSCYEIDVTAVPTTRISGHVVGPDGQARASTSVSLFRAEQYKDGGRGAHAYQGDGKPFEFSRLPPGDYVLLFGNSPSQDSIDPDNPFPQTFYRSAPDIRSAEVIHLADGQQILNADIRLPAAFPSRALTVVLQWNGRQPADYYKPRVIVETTGRSPYPREIADNTYKVNLLLDKTYRVRIRALCRVGRTGEAETETVSVAGRDASVSRVTLAFRPGSCAAR